MRRVKDCAIPEVRSELRLSRILVAIARLSVAEPGELARSRVARPADV